MYVAVMMTLAEATAPHGTWLGAFFTLLLYGIAPVALVMYLLSTPARRRARRAAEAAQDAAAAQAAQAAQAESLAEASAPGVQPDAGSLPPGHPAAPEGKEAGRG